MTNSTLWRRPAAAFHVAGAALFLAGLALTPWEEQNTTTAYHDALAASPDQAQAAALVLHFSYLLLAAGAFALLGVLGGVQDGAPLRSWWTRIGAALVVLGATTMPGLLITDAYDLALAQQLPRSESVPASDAVGDMVLSAVLGMTAMLGFIVGPALLWVAAWRARVVPAAVPALVVGSWLVGMATMELPVLLAGAAILLAATGIAAAALWPRETADGRAPGRTPTPEPGSTPDHDRMPEPDATPRSEATPC